MAGRRHETGEEGIVAALFLTIVRLNLILVKNLRLG